MRLSAGVRHVLTEITSWLLATAVGVGTVLFFDEMKAAVILGLGLPASPQMVAGHRDGTAAAERPPAGAVEIRAGRHGHFLTTAHLNGTPVPVLVDTGASYVALTYEDAQRLGIYVSPSDFTQRVNTANGIAKIAPVVLDSVGLGNIVLRNVSAAVSEPGRLGTTLLGMTFLGRLTRTEMRNGVLILQE